MKFRKLRRLIRRRGLLLGCLLLAPLTVAPIAEPVANWLTRTGLAHGLVVLAFLACLFLLNRVTLDLYQEFQNRE
jgi:hypothetical protein